MQQYLKPYYHNMNIQNEHLNQSKERFVGEFVEQMFKFNNTHTVPLFGMKSILTTRILKLFAEKASIDSSISRSFHSSIGSDILKHSVKQSQLVRREFVPKDLSWEPDNVFASQSISRNKKNLTSSPQNGSFQSEEKNKMILLSNILGQIQDKQEEPNDKQIQPYPDLKFQSKGIDDSCSLVDTTKKGKKIQKQPKQLFNSKLKEKAIKLTEERGVDFAASETGVSKKRIMGWYRFRDLLHKKGRKPIDPQMEDVLVSWILITQNTTDAALTQREIRDKAREISNLPGFRASKGWLQKFYNRHRLVLGVAKGRRYYTRRSQKAKDDHGKSLIKPEISQISNSNSHRTQGLGVKIQSKI